MLSKLLCNQGLHFVVISTEVQIGDVSLFLLLTSLNQVNIFYVELTVCYHVLYHIHHGDLMLPKDYT